MPIIWNINRETIENVFTYFPTWHLISISKKSSDPSVLFVTGKDCPGGGTSPGRWGSSTLCSSILLLCIPAIRSISSSAPFSSKKHKKVAHSFQSLATELTIACGTICRDIFRHEVGVAGDFGSFDVLLVFGTTKCATLVIHSLWLESRE